MRIAFFHELPYGGARRAVNQLAKEFKKNHSVDLYIVDEKEDKSERVFFRNTHFYRFIPKKWVGKNWRVRLYKDSVELFKLYILHRNIAKDIRSRKYDVVFIHSSKYTEAPFLLRFKNKIKIFYCHDPHYRMLYESILDIPKNIDIYRREYERINRKIRKIIDRTNIQKADIILANSEYTKAGVKKTYGIDAKVCYLGVDSEIFKPKKIKKNIDLFYIGSYEPVDGYPLFKDVLKFIRTKIKIRTIFVEKEWINDDHVLSDCYNRTKIMISFADHEPLGLVPLEAMACGTPVIATNEAGHKETVINNRTGLLVSKDPKKIARSIDNLLRHPNELERMGKTAREIIVKNWTWKTAAERVERIFNNAVSTYEK